MPYFKMFMVLQLTQPTVLRTMLDAAFRKERGDKQPRAAAFSPGSAAAKTLQLDHCC